MNNYRLGFELGFIKRAGYFGDLWKGVKSIADPSAWSMLGTKAEDLPKDEKANFRPWTKPSRGAKELTDWALKTDPKNPDGDHFWKRPISGAAHGLLDLGEWLGINW